MDFLNVGKHHSLLLSVALSFSPIICKTPGLIFNSSESFLDLYYRVKTYSKRELCVSICQGLHSMEQRTSHKYQI